jgi:hypothetical protein
MNPLKERRTVTTAKAITTLFISSVLLVGFVAFSLSLSQTASATVQGGGPPPGSPSEDRPETPQCTDPDERFEPGRGCVEAADEECPTGFALDTIDGEEVCRSLETKPEECPSGFGFVTDSEGNRVCRSITTAPNRCAPQQFDPDTGRCYNTHPVTGAKQFTDRDPCPPNFDPEGSTCRSTETTTNRVCPTGFDFDTIDGQRVCRSLTTTEDRDFDCPEGELEVDECVQRPGRGPNR